MTQEEINKRNEAIALFMGGKLSKPRNAMNAPYWKFASKATWSGNPEKIYTLYYNKLWDWLMPVVEKIESDKGKATLLYTNPWDYRGLHTFSIYKEMDENKDMRGRIVESVSNSKIEAVFIAVSDFCLNQVK
jgi:hypothetical protein